MIKSMQNPMTLAFFVVVVTGLAGIGAAVEATRQPKALERTAPRIPEKALARLIPGDALVSLEIDQAGAIVNSSIAEEVPEGYGFGRSALESVREWKFAPGQPGTYVVAVFYRWQEQDVVPKPEPSPPLAPQPVKYKAPVYPELAVTKKIEGDVRLLVFVEDGDVERGAVILETENDKEAALFGDLAMKAVRQWKFSEDVNGTYVVAVEFSAKALSDGRIRTLD